MDFEKQDHEVVGELRTTQQPRVARARRILEYSAVAVLVWLGLSTPKLSSWSKSTIAPIEAKAFSWDDVAVKPTLDYVPCFDGFQCARLELPMDYWNSTTEAKIALAVIRKPAVVPVTHPHYAGAILTNPGGPGGSGVGFLQRGSAGLRAVIDSEDSKYFDLISFDPRGVGATTPGLHCFQSRSADWAWQLRLLEEGWFESSDAALGRIWSMSDARGRSCAQAATDGNIRKYVTTASVATDMLQIVERHAEWRELEARRLSCKSKPIAEHIKHHHGKEKINYIGFSYGTYLGQTFAAMYPDRIGRFVVDGVVDVLDYRKVLWTANLVDTEKDMDLFYYHCARVGYPACALASDGHNTASAVKARTLNITQSLLHKPLPVVGLDAEVITYSDVRNLIFLALYSPTRLFAPMAKLLADLEKGDGTVFALVLRAAHTYDCGSGGETGGASIISRDPLQAIACTDGDSQSLSRAEFEDYSADLAQRSPTIGSFWSSVRMNCIHYDVRAPHRFVGPWQGNTSNSILFIGNTADPVTPGINAINMAKTFEGAVALIQDGPGHCAVASTYSRCTVAFVRKYFASGELPPAGTVCPVDELPFGGVDKDVVDDAEFAIAKALQPSLADALLAHGGFSRLLPAWSMDETLRTSR
ncbi:hypothetical protein B0A48_09575 [Cryoendolithus antarcticus]|uniref:Uncharacterized protein n=1 Tax=Cryoendolithus antarcticus TaxID=1507870 RepID=A0A1V8SZQ9_9PEZI|nr:hypothetical protein B0A48_09575 [Cryoendolithus antarcticus]